MADMALIRDVLTEMAGDGNVSSNRKSFEMTLEGKKYVIGFPCAFTIKVVNGAGENLAWFGRDMNLNSVKDVHPDAIENGKKFMLFDNFSDTYVSPSPTSIVSHPNYRMLKDYIVIFEPSEDLFGDEDLRLISFEIKEPEAVNTIKGYLDAGNLPDIIKVSGTFEALERVIPTNYVFVKVDGFGARLTKEDLQAPLNPSVLKDYITQ